MNRNILIRKINYYLDLPEILRSNGYDSYTQGSIFCPFHPDKQGGHKSAKLFKDPDGWRLFCFAEHKSFTTFDFLSKVLGKSLESIVSEFSIDSYPYSPVFDTPRDHIDHLPTLFHDSEWNIYQFFYFVYSKYLKV